MDKLGFTLGGEICVRKLNKMEFYFGGPNSNAWNDASKLESYIQKMERSFHSKAYFKSILIVSSILLISLLFVAL